MDSVYTCPASHSLFVKFKTRSKKSKADRGSEAEWKFLFLPFKKNVFHHLTVSEKHFFNVWGLYHFIKKSRHDEESKRVKSAHLS